MPRLIKRYSNRKLYDVQASAYVSLEDIAALVRSGETVRVVENATGDDITAQTLMHVILNEGTRGSGLLPTELLHALLRRGSRAIDSGLEQVRHGVDDLVQSSLGRLSRLLPVARSNELRQLRDQLSQLDRTLSTLLEGEAEVGGRNVAPRTERGKSTRTGGRKTGRATPKTGRAKPKHATTNDEDNRDGDTG